MIVEDRRHVEDYIPGEPHWVDLTPSPSIGE
jgi:hypothetical protein